MKLNLHNKLEILIGDKSFCFYNTMLPSIRDALAQKKSYNDFLAVGTGAVKNFDVENEDGSVQEIETNNLETSQSLSLSQH